MKANIKKWIEAGKIFEKNNKAKFNCPECQVGELLSKDEVIGGKVDRYIYCNACGEFNVLTLILAQSYTT
jgi:transcription elongation factor Elf1